MARTVLPIVGAVVGTFFGAPQLGYAIGSVIGNAVDPQRIKGPRVGDATLQTSQEGAPRPIVYGTSAVMGNLIDRGPLNKVITEERQGKGGGPVVENESLFMTFAIRICEGEIDGVSRIWEDERLVYDVRPESEILDDSLRYAEGFTLYLGSETQLPDPDLETIHGVGNTPAHRGTAYIVFKEKNLTDRRGSIPQFRFEVNGCLAQIGPDSESSEIPSVVRFMTHEIGPSITVDLPVPSGTQPGDLVVVCGLSETVGISEAWIPAASEYIELDFGNAGAGAYGRAFAIVLSTDDAFSGIPLVLDNGGLTTQSGKFLIYSIEGAAITDAVPLDVDSAATPTDTTTELTFSYAGNFIVQFAFFQCRLSGTAGDYPFQSGQQTLSGSNARIYACFDVVPDIGSIAPTDWDRQGTSSPESAGVASVGLTL
jgi:hypothetical protein